MARNDNFASRAVQAGVGGIGGFAGGITGLSVQGVGRCKYNPELPLLFIRLVPIPLRRSPAHLLSSTYPILLPLLEYHVNTTTDC